MAQAYCTNGHPMSTGSIFCRTCGARQAPPPTPPVPAHAPQPQQAYARSGSGGTGWIVAAIVLIVVALAAIGSGTSNETAPTDDLRNKYEQTWSKSYSDTTCDEWNNEMSDDQQWAAAADMLTGAQSKDDSEAAMPSDDLIGEFQSGVTTACVIPTHSVAEIGAGVYLTERARFRP